MHVTPAVQALGSAARHPVDIKQSVTLAMAELACDLQEGLLALGVGTGLVMAAMMNSDLEESCKGRATTTDAVGCAAQR